MVNEAFSDDPAGAYSSNIWYVLEESGYPPLFNPVFIRETFRKRGYMLTLAFFDCRYDTIGAEYVLMAFEAATKAVKKNGLKVKLYYNDYNIESPGAKSTAAQTLVKQLKGRGIQIDGVGLESHFIAGKSLSRPNSWSPQTTLTCSVGSTPSLRAQTKNKKAFTALDVDVAVTELDVRLDLPPTARSEKQQVLDYYNSVKSCVNVKRCVGVTVWDFDDTYSWIPGVFDRQGYADLFLQPGGAGHPLVKKAAHDGCLEALTGQPEGV